MVAISSNSVEPHPQVNANPPFTNPPKFKMSFFCSEGLNFCEWSVTLLNLWSNQSFKSQQKFKNFVLDDTHGVQDGPSFMAEAAMTYKYPFPYLYDEVSFWASLQISLLCYFSTF